MLTKKPTVTGKEIRRLREKAGISQEEAAKVAGVAAVTWRSWEYGNRIPQWPQMLRIAEALKVDSQEFRSRTFAETGLACVAAWWADATRKERSNLLAWLDSNPPGKYSAN